MEVERIYTKLDSLSEHISEIREQNARMEVAIDNYLVLMARLQRDLDSNTSRVDNLEKDAARQRGVMVATSTIFGALAGVLIGMFKTFLKAN